MPEEKPNALREGQNKGDEVDQMIAEGLKEAFPEPKEVPDAKPEAQPEAKPEEAAASDAEPAAAKEKPEQESVATEEKEPEGEPEGARSPEATLESVIEENKILKTKLGKSGNQVGSLKEQLTQLGETLDGLKEGGEGVPAKTVLDEFIETVENKYGAELSGIMRGLATAIQAPQAASDIIGSVKGESPDYANLDNEVAAIIKADPELRAAMTTPEAARAVLRVTYQAARTGKLSADVGSAENKGVARAAAVEADKGSVFAETPSVSADKGPAPVVTEKEKGEDYFANRVMKARADGNYDE